MNPFQRRRVCQIQVHADNLWGNTPIGGVIVKDENGNEVRLNSTPKTNWRAELMKANEMCAEIEMKLRLKSQT